MNSLLQRLCTQTIVLWANPINNGFGGNTFDTPTEILGRWEDKLNLVNETRVSEQISNAYLYTVETIEKENWVYLGTLADLTTAQKANPKLVGTAYMVKKIEKFVDIKGNLIYKKVSL